MNLFFSVRFRLFALCVSLLVVLGGANLLLGNINRQHEAQVLQLQEQYRRVSVIYDVQQALGTWRYWQGQVNAAGLVQNGPAEIKATGRAEEANAELQARLAMLAAFDSPTVTRVRRALEGLPPHLRAGVIALARHKPEAEAHFNRVAELMNVVDEALHAAAGREQSLAEEVQHRASQRASRSQQLSILIIVGSTGFGLLLTVLVLNSIVRPMQSTVKAIRSVNAGETSIDLPPVRQDEFGDMAIALRQFRDQAERLRRLAYGDALTGIGNRAGLEEELAAALDACKRHLTTLAVFYIDLDNFRAVNDSLGHSVGDRYLCEAVARLQRFIPSDALLCRYGGDKFTVLLRDLSASGGNIHTILLAVAGDILGGIAEPYQLGNDLLPMSVSIGIATFPADGDSTEQLISSAEAAMYLAKRQGRNNVQFATPELTGDARRQLSMVTEIRAGLENDEFEPFYQPVVDVVSGAIVGAEALLRWRHPQKGIVNAGDFIPAAEASGLIHSLGERCINKVCEQAAKWSELGSSVRISVNLSARQIEDRTAIALLERLHAMGGLGAQSLDFEITETAILQHIDRAQETLKQIRALGHQLSVDDFGIGYSSLVYLQRFPINRIKIDRSFVAKVESREAQAIISATVVLARNLSLDVVAEGVESREQVRSLMNLGCTLQQGYHFTRALPAAEFDAWRRDYVSRWSSAAA